MTKIHPRCKFTTRMYICTGVYIVHINQALEYLKSWSLCSESETLLWCCDMDRISEIKLRINTFLASRTSFLSADNICKQYGPRSGPSSGSKLFDNLIVFLKEFFEFFFLKKVNRGHKKHKNLPSMHGRSNVSAHVLLNLFNKLGKRNIMRGLPSILSLFRNKFFSKFRGARYIIFTSYLICYGYVQFSFLPNLECHA